MRELEQMIESLSGSEEGCEPKSKHDQRGRLDGTMGLVNWDQGDVGLALGIIGVLGIPLSILATRHWGNRRRKIMFDWMATPLISAAHGPDDDLLGVTFRGEPVKDPYLLRLRMVNLGPTDLASSHFDGGRTLVIEIASTMYGLLKASHPASTETTLGTAAAGEGRVELKPSLLRCGEEWTVEAWSAGLLSRASSALSSTRTLWAGRRCK